MVLVLLQLVGDDAWHCPNCRRRQHGTIKSLSLWNLPDILVIHLKRFKQVRVRQGSTRSGVKLDSKVKQATGQGGQIGQRGNGSAARLVRRQAERNAGRSRAQQRPRPRPHADLHVHARVLDVVLMSSS